MEIKNFNDLIKLVSQFRENKRVAVVSAHDEHTLKAVFKAREDNLAQPVLIGQRGKISQMLEKMGLSIEEQSIVDVKDEMEAAYKAVELVNENKVDFIMKGSIQTADLLRAVVDRERGIRTGRLMTHFGLFEVPGYHKLLVITDGGMVMYPSLEQKKEIIQNAVAALLSLGYERPKVGVLAAVEKVNPKMVETVEGKELKEMTQRGEIENCIVEGPISYDLAISKESAKIKGYDSPVAGDVDILLVPNIAAGNILAKALMYSANGKMAGVILGARVPIVLTSRGSTSEEKYLSIALSAALNIENQIQEV